MIASLILLSTISYLWENTLSMPAGAWLFQKTSEQYLPLSPAEMSRRFPVEYIGTINGGRLVPPGTGAGRPFPAQIKVGPSGATVVASETDEISISGRDQNGALWSVNMDDYWLAYGGQLYSADLDRNGILDLILKCPIRGNSVTPHSYLIILTYDERGRPVPFKTDRFFGEEDTSIPDLVDLDGDGRAELISMIHDKGYWITNLYRIRGARWQRVKGLFSHRSYPLYTRFTYRPNRKVTVPIPSRHPFAPDISNLRPCLQGQLASYRWTQPTLQDEVKLVMKTKRTQQVIKRPIHWTSDSILVLDTPAERTILLGWSEKSIKRISSSLKRIVADADQVSAFGESWGRDRLQPEIIWASHTKSKAHRELR